jgi:hypothetical protein
MWCEISVVCHLIVIVISKVLKTGSKISWQCHFNKVIFLVKVAVNVAVLYNFVAVKGCQMAVNLGWSGSEGVLGSGNTGFNVADKKCFIADLNISSQSELSFSESSWIPRCSKIRRIWATSFYIYGCATGTLWTVAPRSRIRIFVIPILNKKRVNINAFFLLFTVSRSKFISRLKIRIRTIKKRILSKMEDSLTKQLCRILDPKKNHPGCRG